MTASFGVAISATVLLGTLLTTGPGGLRGGAWANAMQPGPRHNRIVDLLARNQVVFGWFSPTRTPDAAKKAVADGQMDFVFLNMERVQNYQPADVKAFLQTLTENGVARNPNNLPIATRIPIFHDDPVAARQRIAEMLNLGVHAIVFPDMESGEEARQAIAAMRFAQKDVKPPSPEGVRPDGVGDAPAYWGVAEKEYRQKADVYPINPDGELASIFIVESVRGIANSREITRERPTVAFPGPGTLRSVFQGDMAKVESAIQTQLASCKEFNVPCGITANVNDIEKRIKEGFRMIIIYDRDYPETIKAGRAAAGR
jgi:4-hydroxy-2-oxoheptanedioate aldolase